MTRPHTEPRSLFRRSLSLLLGGGILLAVLPPSAVGDSLASELPAAPDVPAAGSGAPAPGIVVPAGLTGTPLDYKFKCGGSPHDATLFVPARGDYCLHTSYATAWINSLSATFEFTPTSSGGIVMGIGYKGFNLGFLVSAVAESTVQMTVSASYDGCTATGSVRYETLGGDAPFLAESRLQSLLFSRGSNMFSNLDDLNVAVPFSSSTVGPKTLSVTVKGLCGGMKEISASLPTGLSSLSGKYQSNTFSLTGIPTSLSIQIEDTSSTSKRVEAWHNSNSLSGSLSLSGIGTVTITNAPKHYKVTITKNSDLSLARLTVVADTTPSGGSGLKFEGTVAGIAIKVDVRKVTSLSAAIDMNARSYALDSRFYNQDGFVDADIVGTWKSLAYNVQIDGSGIGRLQASIIIGVEPIAVIGANLRQTGSVQVVADLSFYGFSLSPTLKIERPSGSSQYHLVIPFYFDQWVSEGFCKDWKYIGVYWIARLCALGP